jgi:predicted nucleic acid-binding protein
MLVVDSSFGFRSVVPGPHQARYDAFRRDWRRRGDDLVAPTLWCYEVTSALTKAVRFGPLRPERARASLNLIDSLGVRLIPPDENQTRRAFEWTLRLGRAAAYDSFYLALAEQLGCEFWTADERLYNAANRPWVRWLANPAPTDAKRPEKPTPDTDAG